MNILNRFGDVAQNPGDAYLPYLAAVEEGVLDPAEAPDLSPQDAIAALRSGVMPPLGGVVDLGRNRKGAFDLVVIEYLTEKEMVIVPSSKLAVDDETDIIRVPGPVTLSDDLGKVSLIAAFDRPELAMWRPENYKQVGNMALRELGIDAPHYEVVRIDDGAYIARRPMRYF